METIATAALAPAGFASLACDARGTGASGGAWGLGGPSEVQDVRDLFNWLWWAGVVLGLAFLAGQITAWEQLLHRGVGAVVAVRRFR